MGFLPVCHYPVQYLHDTLICYQPCYKLPKMSFEIKQIQRLVCLSELNYRLSYTLVGVCISTAYDRHKAVRLKSILCYRL